MCGALFIRSPYPLGVEGRCDPPPRERKSEIKCQLVVHILSPDASAVRFDNSFAYRKSKPGTRHSARGSDAIELIEDAFQMFRRYLRSLVADLHMNCV